MAVESESGSAMAMPMMVKSTVPIIGVSIPPASAFMAEELGSENRNFQLITSSPIYRTFTMMNRHTATIMPTDSQLYACPSPLLKR